MICAGKDAPIGLVLLAAGFGSRFGGDKQLSVVGPENSIIMDYTIFDAWRIGYSWVTVILREEIVDEFEREVGQRWRDKIQLNYSIQHSSSHIPDDLLNYPEIESRQKPWGTGHALLCAEEQIFGPFAVANADDFYGYHGLKEIFFYLRNTQRNNLLHNSQCDKILDQAMVGFLLGRTLSENGNVSRGICHTYLDAQGRERLDFIKEHTKLRRGEDGQIHSLQDATENIYLPDETLVSMNLFGFQKQVFPLLQQQFEVFLRELVRESNAGSQGEKTRTEQVQAALQREFYLPGSIMSMLKQKQTNVSMLHSPDPWFGLTYLEDVPAVRQSICNLVTENKYPVNLFAQQEAQVN